MIRKKFKVTDLSVKYKHKLILNNIDFTIETGKIIGIIGPNGAGKSTLFKAILGLINKEKGTIFYDNIPLEKQRELIAYIPQRSQIDWDFPVTVWDIVLMGRIIKTGWFNQFSKESYEKVDYALEKLEIAHLKNRKIGELSGGQQQRVFLARSIAQGAEIFCLDEPLSGVDYKTQANIFKILRDLAIQNKLIIVIHHDLSDIVKYFDELILLNQKIIALGQCEDVLKENLLHEAYV
uniref:Probable ATP-dependent transporter ycf16 n=1 Tax=Porphyridium purpureum TaxID=35688 RepID=W0RYW0_PORPP|nr:manganese transport system ATP-binding protein [Porphyridium purpureum]ATJ02985.1 manganese transport system ATP-binding protein [Porphyridium purpureum]BAO23771.1 manganese transport system ATP-binding protein [Porphyridium purpureum]